MTNYVVAVLCSDIHIESCPSWRSAEPDWFAAMVRSLSELKAVAEAHDVPIVCAGDILTRWYASPELINFAIKHLPGMYSVRGNHDLPNHRHEEYRKSAYCTLVEAGVITDLTERTELHTGVVLHPFPWGKKIVPLEHPGHNVIDLAVVHRYIWKEGCGYVGAPDDCKASAFRQSLRGYDASVWGDNHKGFIVGKPLQHMLMNCGTFFRRHSDEINYRPHIGLLYRDGSIVPHYLDISKDVHTQADPTKTAKSRVDASKILLGFEGLGKDSLDFERAVKYRLEELKPDAEVMEMVLRSIRR